jgi:hypothetical protein
MTYQQKPEGVLGVLAKSVGDATRNAPILRPVAPFTNIIANVVNNAIDWTPWGIVRFADQVYRAKTPQRDMSRGGWRRGYHSSRRRGQDLGRAILGTLAMAGFAALASQDKLTGRGPSNYSKRQQLMASGWKPHSFVFIDKNGNKEYVPYTHRLGPLALVAGITANYNDALKYGDMDENDALQRTSIALLGTANLILDMSFLEGISKGLEAITNYDIFGRSYLKNLIAQTTSPIYPNLFKQIDRMFDPTVYDNDTVLEAIQGSMRFTDGLRPKIDIFGDPVIGDRLTQISKTKQKADDIKTLLAKEQLWISVPNENTKIYDYKTDQNIPMTAKQHYDFIKISGQNIKKELEISKDIIESMPDQQEKQDYVDAIVKQEREYAKRDIEDNLTP